MTPSVLKAYRSGNITYQTMQNISSPVQEIYAKTYKYLQYPELSHEEQKLVSVLAPKTKKYVGNEDVAYHVVQSILPTRKPRPVERRV
jgi:hypothetical protein